MYGLRVDEVEADAEANVPLMAIVTKSSSKKRRERKDGTPLLLVTPRRAEGAIMAPRTSYTLASGPIQRYNAGVVTSLPVSTI